jgi:general stress protein 26
VSRLSEGWFVWQPTGIIWGMTDLADIQQRTFERSNPATVSSYPAENRLDPVSLDRYLDRRAFAVVATTRPDGRPHAAMSSYLRRGSTFWLPTVAGSVRERNIRGRPYASLVIAEGERGEHVVVIAEGPASVVDPEDVPSEVTSAGSSEWVSVWLRVDAERVLSYAAEEARP